MAKLTEKRLDAATDILEKYRRHLQTSGRLDCGFLEKELRERWNIGYQTLKSLIIDLSKIRRFRFVAAYYMEHIYPGGPASEFKPRLAKLYGVTSYHYSKAITEKRKAFWSGLDADSEIEE